VSALITACDHIGIQYVRFDGILGLAYAKIAVNHITPPFYEMYNQQLIDEPVFSFRLGSSDKDGGEAVFGGINHDAYTGHIHYVPVRRKAYWEVELEKVAFGDEELECENTGAAIDTGLPLQFAPHPVCLDSLIIGTSLIVLPTDIAEMLNHQIGAKKNWAGQYHVDCSKVPELPELSFFFGGKRFPLKGSDYVLDVSGTCISSFTGMDLNIPGGNLWIIGTSLLTM